MPCRPPNSILTANYWLRFLLWIAGPVALFPLWVILEVCNVASEWPTSPTRTHSKPPYVPKRIRRQCFWNTPIFIRFRTIGTWIIHKQLTLANKFVNFILRLLPLPQRQRCRRPYKRIKRRNHTYRLRVRAKGIRRWFIRPTNSDQFPAACYQATEKPNHRQLIVDSDSFLFCVDNGASYCMTNSLKNFESYRKINPRSVNGVGKSIAGIEGVIKWRFEDDQGRTHTFTIDECLYIPNLSMPLLSCQHWSQHLKKEGTYAHADSDGE